MSLKYRLITIAALILASVWALFPRPIIERRQAAGGGFVNDTVRRMPLKRGLDLQGGMHLALEIDPVKGSNITDKSDALDRALKVIRTRIDQFGVAEPVIQKTGNDRITVELPGITDPQRAEGVVNQTAYLKFQITDETDALEKVLPRLDQILREKNIVVKADTAKKDSAALSGGLNSLLSKDTTKAKSDTAKKDSSSILNTSGAFSKLLTQGGAGSYQYAMKGQYLVRPENVGTLQQYLSMPEVRGALPPGKEIVWQADTIVAADGRAYRPLYVLDQRPIITGEYLEDAKPQSNPQEGTLVIFRLSNEGGRRFRTETGKHVKDHMAIVLDEFVMGQPPIIEQAIGAHGQITMGGRDLQAAQDLALVLRAGSLPVPLKVVEHRTIGASLGQDSIQSGMLAGIIAVVLVIGIMLAYYRFSGVLAVGGLALYVLFTLAVLAGFHAVLTLPGLAGFVLSIGIAVDANVLIFERIREELDHGKSVRTAIDEGFRHAMSAIVDSNVSTALTAAVLYQYGTGPVRGFAVTLLAGIAASMVSSIFIVRTFYMIWLNRSRDVQTLSI
jgi:preprotein translocase subunit SecD